MAAVLSVATQRRPRLTARNELNFAPIDWRSGDPFALLFKCFKCLERFINHNLFMDLSAGLLLDGCSPASHCPALPGRPTASEGNEQASPGGLHTLFVFRWVQLKSLCMHSSVLQTCECSLDSKRSMMFRVPSDVKPMSSRKSSGLANCNLKFW